MNDLGTRRSTFQLAELPYPVDALAPVISARTLEIHHGRHHRTYVDKANTLLGGSTGTAEEVIARSARVSAKKALCNNAAQAWWLVRERGDVWEHANYLDREERRAEYVNAVVDHLLDWDFAAANLEAA